MIDWSLAYRGNKDMREDYNKTAKKAIQGKRSDAARAGHAIRSTNTARSFDEGITNLQKAIELKPDYDDAMAYLNLLYRQKADMETSAPRATPISSRPTIWSTRSRPSSRKSCKTRRRRLSTSGTATGFRRGES